MNTWETEDGRELIIRAACVDSGGHHTQAVYQFCKPRYGRRIFAIKGVGGEGKAIVGRPSKNNHIKCPLFPIGVDTAKETIYSRLQIREEGAGYVHFPDTLDDEYFKQLTAEKVVKKYHKGFYKREWVKTRRRNEALDTFVYAYAALNCLGVSVNLIAQRSVKRAQKVEGDEPKQRRRRTQQPRRGGGFVNGWR
jgi:phage terminase large subunit GpA-like protein